MSDYQVVFITASSRDEADRIAEQLVTERLAACVNIVDGCRSIYRWQGEIVKDDEVMMIVKSDAARFEQLVSRVNELHSYDVPEIIAVDLARVSEGYRRFLDDAVGD